MSPHLIEGLNFFQKPLNTKQKEPIFFRSIKATFGSGTQDEDWIPKVGDESACVLTLDQNIHRIKHQWELCRKHGLGVFFIKMPSKKGYKYTELVQLLIKRWPEIVETSLSTNRPFGCEVGPRKMKILK